ncbi:microfibril-associated glycoprotein 4-like [Anopheles ziemanni]|uniref:microfibril-associated glycoprotein 4-like n=1 Tax=Anopheles coustani TaxID=139045 RepID=UPI0026580B04|nr:microfibril-associated glycoprotein 4-like [Anopheles coustani]XP_058178988.1 microfibril-associated glycoprotein 4-like [Anopheles ziemanni]
MAVGGFEMELLMTKLDYLQDKLQEVESSLKDAEHRLHEKLTKHENDINEKIDSLKKIVKTSEEKTRTNLEEVKNQVISKMDNMQLQLSTETKTIQEKTQTELKQLGENKKTLDILTHSVRNMSTLTEKSNKILEVYLLYAGSSCRHVSKLSHRHMIHVAENSEPFEVLCEQTKFGGGWTVIQHRFNGSVDFYRNWTEYRNGFGDVDGEFWLGLEYVHQITKNRPHELLVEVKDFHGNYGYAKYDEFEIGDKSELYVLKKLGTYSGSAGDSMTYHKNQKFSTFDRDNDLAPHNCAGSHHGAWWYNKCHSSNLNGRYQNTTNDYSAMMWHRFKDDRRGLSYSRMMIRGIIN